MNTAWQEISSNEIAQRISGNVCWDDSSLIDAIFCRTALMVEGTGRVSGLGLRVLVACCSAPASHLELAFLGITESVPMPINLSCFTARFAENGQLRFGFHSDHPSFQCREGYFRFIGLTFPEASQLYQSASVLEPPVGQFATEGYTEFETADGGQVVVSGKLDSPKLFVQAKGSEGSEVLLDSTSARRLLNAMHFASMLE